MSQEILISAASLEDFETMPALQELAYQSEARLYDEFSLRSV
jgi:hypothetical protein